MANKERYTISSLTGYRRISGSNGAVDLIEEYRNRTVNIDPDGKRKFDVLPDGSISPVTIPHSDLKEALLQRQATDLVRKRGIEATPELILSEVKILTRSTRFRGGEVTTLVRMFSRGITQGYISTQQPLPSNRQMADIFNQIWKEQELVELFPVEWKPYQFKNDKYHGRWEPGIMPSNPLNERLIESLCSAFSADSGQVKQLLFMPDSLIEATFPLLEQLVRAVFHAPVMGIPPFTRLHRLGFLPGKAQLKDVFPQLTDLHLSAYLAKPFHPGELRSCDCNKLSHLFYRLGLSGRYCLECARVIAPKITRENGSHRNPAHKACLESFVTALHQLNVTSCRVPVKRILERLQRYGLTERRYYALRRSKLSLNKLKDTPANRWQIRNMAQSLRIAPAHYHTVLLGS